MKRFDKLLRPLALAGCFVVIVLVLGGHFLSRRDFVFQIPGYPLTFDPAAQNGPIAMAVLTKVFEGLMRFDPKRALPEPALAEDYEIVLDEESQEIHFTLRRGVQFHDGHELTAEDVRSSFEHLLRSKSSFRWILETLEGSEVFIAGEAEHVTGIKVEDRYRLTLILKDPSVPFLHYLAMPSAAIVARESTGGAGGPEARLSGTGPFILQEQDRAERRIVLRAFDDYHGGRPRIDHVVFRSVSDADQALDLYRQGEIDLLTSIPSLDRGPLLQELKGDLRDWPGLKGWYLDLLSLSDQRVRQKVAEAIDPEQLCDEAELVACQVARTLLPPGLPGYDPTVAAPTLGTTPVSGPLPALKLFDYCEPSEEKVVDFLVGRLRAAGFDVDTVEEKGGSNVTLACWIADYPDPDNFLYPLLYKSTTDPVRAQVNQQIEQGRREKDRVKRLAHYREAERQALRERLYVPLYFEDNVVLVHSGWEGLVLPAMGWHEIRLDTVFWAWKQRVWSWAAAVALGMALVGLVVLTVRSATLRAALLFVRMGRLEPDELPAFLNRTMARLTTVHGQAVLARLGAMLARVPEGPRASLSEVVAATAPLMGLLASRSGRAEPETFGEAAAVLDTRTGAFERLARREQAAGNWGDTATPLAIQDGIFAGLLCSESPVHLAAMRDELGTLRTIARQAPAGPFLDPVFLDDLASILDTLAPLHRLPGPDDQALLLGQALSRTLEVRERLRDQTETEPTLGRKVGKVVVEAIRHVLTTTLQDLTERADLELVVRSKVISGHREAVVALEIKNVGQGHAQNVAVELVAEGDGLVVLKPEQTLKSLLKQQSAFLEFPVEPRSSDRIRLRFEVTYDDLGSRGHRRQFADVVELRAAEPAVFRPLHPNPYVVGRPLLDADPFIGREEVFERLVRNLRGASQDNIVVLIGQRRMGKTSILRRLHLHLGEAYVPVLVDLQGLYGAGEVAFFREVAATVHDTLAELGIEMAELSPEELAVDPGRVFRRRFLKDVRQALGERRLLLAFDEFEVLEDRIVAGDLSPRILPYFRSLMQHEERVSFVFAGTHRLDDLTGDYWGALFNLAVYLDVGHLSRSEVEELFTWPTEGAFEIDPLALAKVYHFTGGHPHFSQLLARELVEFRNRRQLAYITIQDINDVARIVTARGQLHFHYLWEEATRDERLFLLALSELQRREGTVTRAGAHRYLTEHRVEAGDLPAAVRRLTRREIVAERGGQLSFSMGLLPLWLEGRHSFESFLLSQDTEGRHPSGRRPEIGTVR